MGNPSADESLTRFHPHDVAPDVAERQSMRYREMSAAEKLLLADALWDLAWDAMKAGVRMRNPLLNDAAVALAARDILLRAAD